MISQNRQPDAAITPRDRPALIRMDRVILPALAAVLAVASISQHAPALGVVTGAVREPRIASAGLVAFASLAALACWTSQWLAWRRGVATARWLGGAAASLAERATAIVSWVAIVSLGLPALQELVGAGAILPSRPAEPSLAAVAALFAAASVEELLLRAAPLELLLVIAPRVDSSLARRIWTCIAVAVAAILAACLHTPSRAGAAQEWLITYYASKWLAAVVFAALYLRRGLVDAVLVHTASNLSIAALVPRWFAA